MIQTNQIRPKDVREACQLILGALVISTMTMLSLFSRLPYSSEANRYGSLLFFGIAFVTIDLPELWLLRMIWTRRNWSRFLMLAYLSGQWILFARSLWQSPLSDRDPVAFIGAVVCVVMEAFACALLFSSKASQWFTTLSAGATSQRVA